MASQRPWAVVCIDLPLVCGKKTGEIQVCRSMDGAFVSGLCLWVMWGWGVAGADTFRRSWPCQAEGRAKLWRESQSPFSSGICFVGAQGGKPFCLKAFPVMFQGSGMLDFQMKIFRLRPLPLDCYKNGERSQHWPWHHWHLTVNAFFSLSSWRHEKNL